MIGGATQFRRGKSFGHYEDRWPCLSRLPLGVENDPKISQAINRLQFS
jgi:hypothetical protein